LLGVDLQQYYQVFLKLYLTINAKIDIGIGTTTNQPKNELTNTLLPKARATQTIVEVRSIENT